MMVSRFYSFGTYFDVGPWPFPFLWVYPMFIQYNWICSTKKDFVFEDITVLSIISFSLTNNNLTSKNFRIITFVIEYITVQPETRSVPWPGIQLKNIPLYTLLRILFKGGLRFSSFSFTSDLFFFPYSTHPN